MKNLFLAFPSSLHMPTDIAGGGSGGAGSASPGVQAISNDPDDFVVGGIGPDQSDCRVKTLSYVSFDYAGKYSADPFIAVKATCEPLDGSNEGKDFDIEWTTGAKMAEFSIINDGGNLAPSVTGGRSSLSHGSNWDLLAKSLKDATYDTKQLNGPRGIRHLEGIEWTIRRVKQPTREGLQQQTTEGREKMYYTCLKIARMPGEKAPARSRATAQPKPAATPTAAPAAAPAHAPAAVSSNGSGGGDSKLIGYIQSALQAAGGTITLTDLPKAVFHAAKAAGENARASSEAGKSSANEDFLIEQGMTSPAPWSYDSGTLTAV